VDVAGTELTAEDSELLRHPLLGGVILFTANHHDRQQLAALVAAIKALRTPPLLVVVDQEGGRVQRLRTGFTRLPAPAVLGKVYERAPARALRLAETMGWLMAAELLAVGIDLSLAPVLDLAGHGGVIGNRAFHATPVATAALGLAWMRGARRAGMASVGKHFPGHGGIAEDSHTEVCRDERAPRHIMEHDVAAFMPLLRDGMEGVMSAHVCYPQVDTSPASLSPVWLQRILRRRLGFTGAIIADDVCMHAAGVAGDYPERVRAALEAGNDMVLLCHRRDIVVRLTGELSVPPVPEARLTPLYGHPPPAPEQTARQRRLAMAIARLLQSHNDAPQPAITNPE